MKSLPDSILRRGIRNASPSELVQWLKDNAPASEAKKALLRDSPEAVPKKLFARSSELLSIGIKVNAESGDRISIGRAESAAPAGRAHRRHSGDR